MKSINTEKITNKDLEEIYTKCLEYANRIKNPSLRECCLEIYNDYKEKLIAKPSTESPRHHFFRGGLMYHSYCVTRNAIIIAELYDYLDLDMDLIIFGSLLHDIGKTGHYKDFDLIKDGERGILSSGDYMVGHSYAGTHIVENYLTKYNLDDQFKYQALHMIGSHMKDYGECGTLISQKMLEVLIISYADSIDAKLDSMKNGINNVKKGEPYFNYNQTTKFYKSANPYHENNIK